jgi:hypothetical protein
MRVRLLLLLCILPCFRVIAADTLRTLATRPISARSITTDELGNIYAIHTDNTLGRYNERGDSTGFYRSALNGNLSFVDATNPLRLLLYYRSFNKIQLLDRQLALKSEVDLRNLRIYSPTAVATASDGNLWVYDPVNARILKLDESGGQVSESIDLRQQLSFVPKAAYLIERDRRLYLSDTARGILVFDQFATYITTLPFRNVGTFQAFDQQLVFARGDTLHSYDMQHFSEKLMPLPGQSEGIVDVCLNQRRLAILYLGRMAFYEWPLGKAAANR